MQIWDYHVKFIFLFPFIEIQSNLTNPSTRGPPKGWRVGGNTRGEGRSHSTTLRNGDEPAAAATKGL